MAILGAFTNAFFWVNGSTDLSNRVKSLSINYSAAELDSTAMGNAGIARVAGLKDWSIDVTFNQDFTASNVDNTIFALVGTTACYEVRPVNACSSVSNPSFTGVGIISKYTPLSGTVGSLLPAPINIMGANGSALSRSSGCA